MTNIATIIFKLCAFLGYKKQDWLRTTVRAVHTAVVYTRKICERLLPPLHPPHLFQMTSVTTIL